MTKPAWAQAKVRFGLATCWAGVVDGENTMQGVSWFHDTLFFFSAWIFNHLVFPFLGDVPGFPIKIVELYDAAYLTADDIDFEGHNP